MLKKDTQKICIIGMPGSGKSTVGRILSEKLNFKFFDTDEEIEAKTKLKIRDIFKKQGESGFREIETNIFENLIKVKNVVISTGGGLILNNHKILNKTFNIYLKCDLEILIERTSRSKKRPLLIKELESNMKNLFNQRKDIYNKFSDLEINATNILQSTITEILNKLPR
tara:strand:+ start:692 stop:1198 length:507 start_codon:yes stop_codon:yes gene_type:complete